jgi:hypothetical protein
MDETLHGYCLYCHLVNVLIIGLYLYAKFPFTLMFGIWTLFIIWLPYPI